MDKKRVSVFVAGQRFTILTDEDEKYVIDIAAKIDARISSLTISQNMTRERAAVLTALDFADDNEQDKRAIAEIKEQIKDYITEISKLSEENTALNAENNQLKREIAALKETQNLNAAALQDAQNTKAGDEKEKEALKAQIRALKEQMELVHVESTPAPVEEEPAPEKEEVTAEDDLFFGAPAEPEIKPAKEKKNRHDHSHVNPYRQQFMQKKNEQKGYTQQRQYSLFDKDE
ncbi:MAG: cell division protein ZapA [Ruminococcus sp.]|nr:cell division protein ZapA [Ruminococcus sp.]